jgi:hypothetical protein
MSRAVRGLRVGARWQRNSVGHNVSEEADCLWLPAAALEVILFKVLPLSIRRQRRYALPAHRADGIAKIRPALNRGRGSHVYQAQPDSATMMQHLLAPAISVSPVVLIALVAVDGDTHLETQFLIVRDVGLVGKIDVANCDGRQDGGPWTAWRLRRTGFLHCLSLGRDLEHRHFDTLLIDVPVEAPGDKPVAIGVDQIPRYVLAKCHACRSREREFHCPSAPKRNLRSSEHRTDI